MNLSRESTAGGGEGGGARICRADWNSHLENSCNSKSNTFLWRWLGFQLITSLKSLHCLKEFSRLPRETMANCARYAWKDNPDSQPPHNCNHIANLNSVLILEIRLESCRDFMRRDMRKERTGYQKESLLPLPIACPMQCFCCTLSPTTTLLPGAVTVLCATSLYLSNAVTKLSSPHCPI